MMDDCDSIVFYGCSINDLPDEVLEYILSLLPPYQDLESCMLVCKRWKKNVSNVIQHTKHKMLRSLANFDLKWEIVVPAEKFQTITKRYSHSACYHENSMYVFGGCTCTSTTFNDLWKLDLSTRQWSRLLTMGTYPSPKACATILYYDGSLILFGGWTHPSPYPLHQAWKTFNEFHMYDIAANRWCSITTVTNTPPPMAGHSATIHKDNMVVFGGLQGQSGSSNDIWCFNFYTQTWTKQNVTGTKPQSRYGQSQIAVDDTHLLILGGCGGGNMNLNDIWLLNMTDPIWTWRRVAIRNPQWAASHLWCHPACKVGHYVVVFSRNPVVLCPFSYSKWRPTAQMQPDVDRDIARHRTTPFSSRRDSESSVEPPAFDRDVNVNGRRGSLNARSARSELSEDKSLASASSSSSSLIPIGDSSQVQNKTSSLSPYEDISSVSEMNSTTEDSNLILNPSSSNQSGSDLSVAVNINNNNSNSSNSSSYRSGNIKNISKDKNNTNFNRNIPGAEISQTRRLEFVSPPNCNTGMAAFRDTYSTSTVNNGRQRERQLEALRRIEERLRNKNKEKTPPPPPSPSPPLPLPQSSSPSTLPSVSKKETQSQACQTTPPKFLIAPKLAMFVLDISTVLTDECFVTWLPIKSVAEDSPDDMILYSLIHGNGELIMFGGIQKDAMSINQQAQSSLNISNIVSNSLHFMTPPRSII